MDLYGILWEDLGNVQSRVQQTLSALQSIQQAIQNGQRDQPTRQDSKRLNRLVVLAELLYAEISPLTSELVPVTPPASNGRKPTTV